MANGIIERPEVKTSFMFQDIDEFTVPANTAYSLTLTATPPSGYKAAFIDFALYRTMPDWFIHCKQINPNTNNVIIDFVNISSQSITVSTGKVLWLLIPN